MKKIKTIEQLKAEKKRLSHQRKELENTIHSNWTSLAGSLKPGHFARDLFSEYSKKNTAAETGSRELLKSTLRFGISLLASKLTGLANDKLDKFI